MRSWEQLQRWAQRGGLIVTVDDPTASVTAWARVLRENHRDHAGKPPPRRQQDREVLIP